MNFIKYKSGYKYQLAEDYFHRGTEIYKEDAEGNFLETRTDYITLNDRGGLLIKKGYAWDGPSGPAIDTKNFMRGSLVHDALYQLMRYGLLNNNLRDFADRILERICIEDGMWPVRAWWVYKSLALFGQSTSDPDHKRPIIIAPKEGL